MTSAGERFGPAGALIAQDAFVHHYGGLTFRGMGVDFAKLMHENLGKFNAKWRASSTAEATMQNSAQPVYGVRCLSVAGYFSNIA